MLFPFYRVNGRAIVLSFLPFLLYEVTREVIEGYELYHMFMRIEDFTALVGLSLPLSSVIVLFLMTLVMVVSTIASVVKLVKSKVDLHGGEITPKKKRAVVTVIILSVLFCIFNSILASTLLCTQILRLKWPLIFRTIAFWYAVPLNAAVNPVVYFCRIGEMRVYCCELYRNLVDRTFGQQKLGLCRSCIRAEAFDA